MSSSRDNGDDSSHIEKRQSDEIACDTRGTPSPEPPASIQEEKANKLGPVSTHRSMGHDTPIEPPERPADVPDEVYDILSPGRKRIIVVLLSFCAFLTPISSTSVLVASPEVATEYGTTGSIINVSNALHVIFMGLAPLLWGPLSQFYGRRWVTLVTAVFFLACSIGTALSPNLAAFFVFRILTACVGSSFILIGAAVIGSVFAFRDIYRPTERATALGWFLSGTLIGPALGPFIGGIIVTYSSWRVIFWLQTGLAGIALMGSYFLLPETIHHKGKDEMEGLDRKAKINHLWRRINPWRVFQLYAYPNLVLTGLASAALLWNMYQLLAGIRFVLNPRFHLTTPLQGGLFYLAPGVGYIIGTFFGGRYADYTVKKYMKKRGGVRIPEERLYSALPFVTFISVCMLVYGWTLQTDRGGIPLAVILLFLQGVAQLFCFPSLNAYCLDVIPMRSGEVVAANFFLRYLFGGISVAVVLPAIEAMGIGWFSTINSLFLGMGSVCILATIKWGRVWRERRDKMQQVAVTPSAV